MHPAAHIVITSAAALAARRRLGRCWPLFWAAGALTDLDHLAWHARVTGTLDPLAAWRHFTGAGGGPRPAGRLPLHAPALLAACLLLGRRSRPLAAAAWGLALHHALDDLDEFAGPWWRGRATRRKAALHREVFEAAGWRCQSCGAQDVRLHAHHLVQRENGGRDELTNLVALCEPCHRIAHSEIG